MKLSILGQGPLANATAHCCRQYHNVMRVADPTSDLYWFTEDTPMNEDHEPETEWMLAYIFAIARSAPPISGLMLVSSQLPVGSTVRCEKEFPHLTWAYCPENLRHASALTDFEKQDRMVIGTRSHHYDQTFKDLTDPFTDSLILTDPESAEIIKSATNVWLAANIALANELATLCEKVGANPLTVAGALRMDSRLAPKVPGGPFGGGHLSREVHNLKEIIRAHRLDCPIIENIEASNSRVP